MFERQTAQFSLFRFWVTDWYHFIHYGSFTKRHAITTKEQENEEKGSRKADQKEPKNENAS